MIVKRTKYDPPTLVTAVERLEELGTEILETEDFLNQLTAAEQRGQKDHQIPSPDGETFSITISALMDAVTAELDKLVSDATNLEDALDASQDLLRANINRANIDHLFTTWEPMEVANE